MTDSESVEDIQPTLERFLRGDGVERVDQQIADHRGGIGHPYRAIDVLMALERRGAITAAMREAGDSFKALFRLSALDPLHAADMVRSGGGRHVTVDELVNAVEVGDKRLVMKWALGSVSKAQIQARHKVWEAMKVLGGINSPCGSIVWFVVGLEYQLAEWADREGFGSRRAKQNSAWSLLAGALGVLAAHWGLEEKA